VKLAVRGKPLDSDDFAAIGLYCEESAGFYGRSVKAHRTGAANRRFATDVRTGERERLSEKMNEKHTRLDFGRMRLTVDLDGYVALHGGVPIA
jgi:hypothetical protein